ncbi:protein S40-7-like [Malania oleifera]|uniref:protein S40-7-like n=1 Tax=Malania oleifera TaxID=397392 RepID=UPI0025AE84F2|nr:protein S40-7-like [Malania oleifera]
MDSLETSLSRARNRPSPSDRFLGVFSQSPSSAHFAAGVGDELDEDEVFWTGDFAEPSNHHPSPPSTSTFRSLLSKGFGRPESFGILAALPEDEPPRTLHPVFHHKPSVSSSSSSSSTSSRMIPAIPRPPPDRQSSTSGNLYQSAPVDVPMLSKVVRRTREFDDIDDDDEEEDDEMLPPHEIVARSSARSPMLACSVLEGVGRTLKGRDLRQVRNAVWRRTGFID